MNRRNILIATLFFCLFFNIQANTISVKPIDLRNQLPSNTVPRIFQDSDGFMWFGTFDGLCRYDGYRVLTFRSDLKNPHLLTDNEVTCIDEDESKLWIGTRKGLNLLDKKTYKITPFNDSLTQKANITCICVSSDKTIWVGTDDNLYHYNSDGSLRKAHSQSFSVPTGANSIYEDSTSAVWITTWKQGLLRYDKKTDSLIQYPPVGKTNNPFKIYQDNKKQFWICTWGEGVYLFYPDKKESEMYVKLPTYNKEKQSLEQVFYSIIQDDRNNYIWTISFSGIYVFEYTKEGLKTVDVAPLFKDYNNIFSEIVKDRDGNLWIGTFSEGILNINFDRSPILNYDIPSIKAQTGIATSITALYQKGDEIWVNQNRCGLGIFYPKENRIQLYSQLSKTIDVSEINSINSFRTYPGEVWLADHTTPRIYKVKKEGQQPVVVGIIDLSEIKNHSDNPSLMYEDRRNNIWILTRSNLFVKLYNSENIQYVNLPLHNLSGITEDTKGDLWISSTSEGVYRISLSGKPDLDNLPIQNYSQKNGTLPSDNVISICADKNGWIWMGTREGNVLAYNLLDNSITDLNSSMQLFAESILNIIDDDFGNIWIATKKRIMVYNPVNEAFRDFTTTDGVLVNSFLPNAYFKDPSGKLLFGGNRGISVFNPMDKLSTCPVHNQTLITDVKVNHQSVFQENSDCQFNIQSQYLEIGPLDKNIEIDFSSLNYAFPSKIRYAYKLEGIDDDWVYTDEIRLFAVYNQLKTGHYKFYVKASDENKLWNSEASVLKIYKRPALYETWWAYLIYTVLILGGIYFVFTFIRKRIQWKNELKIAKIEKEKSEELVQTKLRYFTNISHDFLTPLTIISCLIDDAETSYDGEIKQLEMIRSNISRLRRLLQQVLDFRKMESGNMKLKITQGDIVSFIKDLCYNHFLSLMKKKNIRFLFTSGSNSVQAYFDADKIDKIVFNLLSNAFKYTPENGEVKIELESYSLQENMYLKIRISDTGVGISPEDLDKVFIRFYNNKMKEAGETNGIGLSLTKELVEIHHGTISVNSQLNVGTNFTLEIPIDKESYSNGELNISEQLILPEKNVERIDMEEEVNQDVLSESKTPILLVEDNEELLILMTEIFSKQYHVITASNGREALEVVRKNEIDIIVSDVMMPEIDGLELCKRLKNDFETSHIPVILLTAKDTTNDRIECYNAGADAYISKPFELKVLKARINNFIAYKKDRQKKFQSDFEINISKLEYPSLDEQFLKNAIQIIEEHIDKSDFDIHHLADKLNMSKSSLYRKIKSITDLSPRDFVRNVRLKHACLMLKDKSAYISEVAYAVGFSDPKYFTSCFKQEFNLTPKEYQKSVH
jgi:signal transduction histidine kinase/ligand-binding sensor domain-containing protein/DNA-binding response OmpR family regulator